MPVLPVTEQRLVLTRGTHPTNRLPTAAVVVVHVAIDRTEVEVPRAVRADRVERTRPEVAPTASIVEIAIVAVASGRQEETVAVRGGEESSVHAVLSRPSNGRVVVKLLPFLLGGHTPVAAPIGCGRVVLGQQGCQVVGETVVAIAGIGAVFGQRVGVAHAVLVSAPIVGVLRLSLAPGEVVAVFLRAVGTHIAGAHRIPLGRPRST